MAMLIDDEATSVPREVSVAVQQIVPKIQRDLNCLADPEIKRELPLRGAFDLR